MPNKSKNSYWNNLDTVYMAGCNEKKSNERDKEHDTL